MMSKEKNKIRPFFIKQARFHLLSTGEPAAILGLFHPPACFHPVLNIPFFVTEPKHYRYRCSSALYQLTRMKVEAHCCTGKMGDHTFLIMDSVIRLVVPFIYSIV
jgi:hypothetical protein